MCEPFFFSHCTSPSVSPISFFLLLSLILKGFSAKVFFFFHFDHLKEMGLSVVKEHGGWVLSSRCMVYVESVTASALAS